jgi:hypothetical protein
MLLVENSHFENADEIFILLFVLIIIFVLPCSNVLSPLQECQHKHSCILGLELEKGPDGVRQAAGRKWVWLGSLHGPWVWERSPLLECAPEGVGPLRNSVSDLCSQAFCIHSQR